MWVDTQLHTRRANYELVEGSRGSIQCIFVISSISELSDDISIQNEDDKPTFWSSECHDELSRHFPDIVSKLQHAKVMMTYEYLLTS